MSGVYTGQGEHKLDPYVIAVGTIVMFYGARAPEGWQLCDGTNGTPDLRDHVLVGASAAGTGTAGGTQSPTTITHVGFALGNHSDHSPTQPSAHSSHSPTQPSAHSAHGVTQPSAHGTHSSDASHTHDAHPVENTGGLVAGVTSRLTSGGATHAADGDHTHDAHSAHSGFAVDAHSAHSGWGVNAHSAHSGFAVDAHSAHSITSQPSDHTLKRYTLGFIIKL